MRDGSDWLASALGFLQSFAGGVNGPSPAADTAASEKPGMQHAADGLSGLGLEAATQATADAGGLPDGLDLERRRDLVRGLFNDFWNGVEEKPPTFLDRLDAAEGYINDRLADRNLGWRLDAETRKQLGLPISRSSMRPM